MIIPLNYNLSSKPIFPMYLPTYTNITYVCEFIESWPGRFLDAKFIQRFE